MRFLLAWQHVEPSSRLSGLDGLRTIVATLDGFELAATAWERAVLPARMDRYDPAMLDMLCLTGEVGWARLRRRVPIRESAAEPLARLVGATPIALFLREHGDLWQELRQGDASDCRETLSADARALLDTLRSRGASFLRELGLPGGQRAGGPEGMSGDAARASRPSASSSRPASWRRMDSPA